MKILHIIHKYSPTIGGPYFALKNIIELEQKLGYTSEVLSCSKAQLTQIETDSVITHLFSYSFPSRFSRSKGALHWLKENFNEYDVFVIHGIWTSLYLETAIFLRSKKLKYIVRPAGSLGEYDINLRGKKILKQIIGRLFLKKIITSSLFVFCTSVKERDEMETFGAKPKYGVLPIPISLDDLSENNFFDLSKLYKLKGDDFTILFLSRLEENKGLIPLIESVETLVKQNHNIRLLIAGDGKTKFANYIKSLVKSKLIENNVFFLGFISSKFKHSLFSQSNLFILPSYSENFGNVIIESIKYNTPVLISENIPLADFVHTTKCGWVCSPTSRSITSTVIEILNNQDELMQRKSNCKKAIYQFSFDNLMETYKKHYESI